MNTFTFSAAPCETKVEPRLAKNLMGRTVPTWRGRIEESIEKLAPSRRASGCLLVGKETLRVILKVKVFYVRSPCWLHGRIHPTTV